MQRTTWSFPRTWLRRPHPPPKYLLQPAGPLGSSPPGGSLAATSDGWREARGVSHEVPGTRCRGPGARGPLCVGKRDVVQLAGCEVGVCSLDFGSGVHHIRSTHGYRFADRLPASSNTSAPASVEVSSLVSPSLVSPSLVNRAVSPVADPLPKRCPATRTPLLSMSGRCRRPQWGLVPLFGSGPPLWARWWPKGRSFHPGFPQ